MPIIIDANRASDFSAPAKNHAPEIYKAVVRGGARVAIGGLLLRELNQGGLGAILIEWTRAGFVISVPDEAIAAAEKNIPIHKSDDPHVLALAIASKTRLVYTNDQDLVKDVKNKSILPSGGKIIRVETPAKIVRTLIRNFGG